MFPVLPLADWSASRSRHESVVRPFVEDWLHRSARGIPHPVRDFLFEYYSFRPSHLLRWSPGVDVHLETATATQLDWKQFEDHPSGAYLPSGTMPEVRCEYLRWATKYLENVVHREPLFGCLGLHEWAMVYRAKEVRHSHVALRLSEKAIAEVVEEQGLRCTHYDAYRFFTPEAVPLNRIPLTRTTTSEHDQPGCIHANMDLYKFAYKIAPYCKSDVLLAAFQLACAAREIDMRASPYDLSKYGYSPIFIETRSGREEYIREQRQIAARAMPIRMSLLEEYLRIHPARM
jgi:hypothetical protein